MALQMEKVLQMLKYVMCIIILIGALNYGSIGLFNRDLISELYKDNTKYAYDVIGISAVLYLVCKIVLHRKMIVDTVKNMI